MAELKALLGDTLMKGTEKVSIEKALEGKTGICLYFSAHWCPPCRGFTPKLSEVYKKKTEEEFEIVFVSSDRSEGDFTAYYSEMPWYALTWENLGKLKDALSTKYAVTGIPKLVAITLDGTVIDMDGRGHVAGKNNLKFPNK
ncbi:nucleoredoxin-like [Mizuhopecten yessoensis]|uniref:nucleoredoxin-like n=1 Tax=Mizuhopecten yessoensis TaxID=6573 RepID=UPI000B45A834|nr:nucleoredoxin-like [Mizuhopecten yessoensis]XP_021363756.1 nucleoredoxin-like [Mizuhopecten yessoensis]